MIRYLFTAIGFASRGSGWQTCTKNRKETAHKEKRYTKLYKNTEYTKWKTNIKRIFENISRVIGK